MFRSRTRVTGKTKSEIPKTFSTGHYYMVISCCHTTTSQLNGRNGSTLNLEDYYLSYFKGAQELHIPETLIYCMSKSFKFHHW